MYTPSEEKVIKYLLGPYSPEEIATLLVVSEKTVKFHMTNIYRKAGVKGRAAFMYKTFVDRGLIHDTFNISDDLERQFTLQSGPIHYSSGN